MVARFGRTVPATEGLALLEGDTLFVRDAGHCRGFTPAGEPFTLDGPARMALSLSRAGGAEEGLRGWIARQLALWTGQRRRQALTTRGVGAWELKADPCRPLFPVDGGAARASSASLCWTTIPGIDRYTVVLGDANGAQTRSQVQGNTLTLTDLEPGREYIWRVEPALAEWPAMARWYAFRVLASDEETKLESALAQLPDLEAAVVLLSLGLNEEAVYRLDAARDSRPHDDSILRWRADALAAMGLRDEAIADLREAARLP